MDIRQVALNLSGEYFIHPLFDSRLSVSVPPSPLSTSWPLWAVFHFQSPLQPFMILVSTWRGYLGQTWRGHWLDSDRLLAISFVYPSEQTCAAVKSRKHSEDQCQIQSKAFFYHIASITGDCQWVTPHTYLIESQFNHLLKVITIPLQKPLVCELQV